MNIERDIKEKLSWDIEGCTASASIDNGQISCVDIKLGDTGNHFTSTDEKFIRDVLKVLQGLISHIDKSRGIGRVDVKEEETKSIETEKQIGNGRKEF